MTIHSITIGTDKYTIGKLTVILGPNNSGKTRLLSEVFCSYIKKPMPRMLWDVKNIEKTISNEQFKIWKDSLVEERREEGGDTFVRCPYSNVKKYGLQEHIQVGKMERIANMEQLLALVQNGAEIVARDLCYWGTVEERLSIEVNITKTPLDRESATIIDVFFRDRNYIIDINIYLSHLLGMKLFLSEHNDPELELIIYPSDVPDPLEYDNKNPVRSAKTFREWKENLT